MIRRTLRSVLRVSAAACLVLAPAFFGTATAAGAASPAALLRGAHFSPDTPGVDVYLTAFAGGTATLWLSKVGYGDVSGYQRVTPGVYAVSMRPHGAAASTPAALSWTLNARAGKAYTAAAIGMNEHLKGIVLRDDLTQPSSGNASFRVIQAASRAPHVDVVAQGGPTIARGAAFGTQTGYTTVAAGSWPLVAHSIEAPTLQARADVSVQAGTVETVVVLDSTSGITLRTVRDAAGSRKVPAGAVPAGGGGPAATAPTDSAALGLTIAGGVAALAGLTLWLRPRRRL